MGKDRGHVLPPPGTLPWIMALPEDVEQFPVGDHGRIEVHLDRLDVVPEVVIRRVLRRPARVPDAGAENPGKTPEPGVRTPESAQGECRRLRHSGQGCIDRGYCRSSIGSRPGQRFHHLFHRDHPGVEDYRVDLPPAAEAFPDFFHAVQPLQGRFPHVVSGHVERDR